MGHIANRAGKHEPAPHKHPAYGQAVWNVFLSGTYVFDTQMCMQDEAVHLHCTRLPLQLPSRLLATSEYWPAEHLPHASEGFRRLPEVPSTTNSLCCLQAELSNQIDPLMLRVLDKCQKHRDQVQGCQVRLLPFLCPAHTASTLSGQSCSARLAPAGYTCTLRLCSLSLPCLLVKQCSRMQQQTKHEDVLTFTLLVWCAGPSD